MLGKLIKYDLRSTWRDFAAAYLSILLGVLILPLIFNHANNQIVNTLAGLIGAAIVIATIVIMVITLFKIFNTNVFSKEGYLTITLPATSTQLVVSKLLVSSMWIVLTGIVSVIAVCIFILNLNVISFTEITDAVRKALSLFDTSRAFTIVLLIIAVIVSAVSEISKLFLACSIAHLKQLTRFRVLVGILSYFLFTWLEVLIVQAFTLVLSFLPYADELTRQLEQMNDFSGIQQFTGLFNGVMGIGIIYSIILTVVYAIGTIWMLNHKLDLD